MGIMSYMKNNRDGTPLPDFGWYERTVHGEYSNIEYKCCLDEMGESPEESADENCTNVLGPAEDSNVNGLGPGEENNASIPVPSEESNANVPVPTAGNNASIPAPAEENNANIPVPSEENNANVPPPAEENNTGVPAPAAGNNANITGPTGGNYMNIPEPNVQYDTPFYHIPGTTPGLDGTWTSFITAPLRPIIPCYFCDSPQYGLIRFLNAAAGYPPFLIYINEQLIVDSLGNGDMSEYGRVSSELLTVTVADANGYVYTREQLKVPVDGAVTAAVINTDSGPDIMVITDAHCNGGSSTGCFRVCNLSITNRGINVLLNGGVVVFLNVNYKEVTSFQYIMTGYYLVSVFDSNAYDRSVLLNSNIYVRGNSSYTLYAFNWGLTRNAIRILIVEDRRA